MRRAVARPEPRSSTFTPATPTGRQRGAQTYTRRSSARSAALSRRRRLRVDERPLWSEFEKRAEVLELDGDVKPEMASLTLGSLNFPGQASVNEPAMIRGLAERMDERGIVPELEVFDFGMLDFAKFLIDQGVLEPSVYFNLLLGSLGTLSARPFNLALLAQSPADDVGRRRNRPIPVRDERPGDRDGRPRSRRTRRQPLARRREGASSNERRPRRTPRSPCSREPARDRHARAGRALIGLPPRR